MLPGFEKIVEERIRVAQRRGVFNNLPGSGKPIRFEDDSLVREELRLAYKILKNADCIPQEIEIKKEINRAEDLLSGMGDTAEKYRILKKLNFLIMKLNTMRDTNILSELPQHYAAKLAEHFGASSRASTKTEPKKRKA